MVGARLGSAAALFLTGCWVSEAQLVDKIDDLTLGDTDGTDTDTTRSCTIVGIDPPFGSEAGGSQAEVSVTGLVGTPSVRFGQRPADVIGVLDDRVLILTPDRPAGTAKVTVETDSQSCMLENAFEFWPDGTGKQGAIGAVHWYTYQGSYWNEDAPHGEAWAAFVKPTHAEYRSLWSTGPETCVSGHGFDFDQLSFHTPGGSLTLREEGTQLTLAFDAGTQLYQVDYDVPYAPDGSYELLELGGDWPQFDLEDFVQTPRSISILQPGVSGATVGTVVTTLAGDFDVQWSDAGAGDYVLGSFTRVVDDVAVEEVTCVWTDDGTAEVPASVWQGWDYAPYSQYLVISLGRVKESTARLPYDNSRSGVAAVYWTNGAVWTL